MTLSMHVSGSRETLISTTAMTEAPTAISGSPAPVVLVVDDDPASLRMLMDALESQGYDVLVATSGEAALQRLTHVVPDAVLLDCLMPGLSGLEVCQRMKADPTMQTVPVIFMTGLGETEDVVRGFASGGVDYVVKPVRIQEVLARLATHSRNARLTRMAHEAVDVAGMGVLFVDRAGRVLWQSPQAAQWLRQVQSEDPWQKHWRDAWQAGNPLRLPLSGRQYLRIDSMLAPGSDDVMLLLRRVHADEALAEPSRVRNAALTPRETEVLSWVAKGKTNRDIADILGLSPRTVNKHLEHVFEKLGVETRAAAAALASRELL